MTKQSLALITALSAALLSANSLFAQQTPADNTQKPAASATPAGKPATAAKPAGAQGSGTQGSGTAKPGTAATAKKSAPAPLVLKTQKDKASYAMGMNIGKSVGGSLKKDNVELDPALVARGLKDALSGGKLLLTEEEAKTVLMAVGNELNKKREAEQAALGAANKKTGDEFLAANKSKEGVVTLPSGLQYKILKAGDGPKPALSDQVTCNYAGTLVNGKEFDSSAKHGGQPVTFQVGGVIKGWTEALQLMPVGSKWQLFVPPDLAYGDRPAGPDIGPKSTLVFEVELLSIAPKPEAKPAAQPDAKPEAKPEAKPAAGKAESKPEPKPLS
jgi:FKBP-type peptidyl-prolyl cis-trans isomerase